MRKTIVLAGLLATFCWTGGVLAQETERFRLEQGEDGYVRMDTRTGAMSICRERSGQLVCTLAADERTAYEDDIASLRTKLDALEARVAALEAAEPAASSGLPSDEEFEKTMGFMERFFRRFMSIVEDIEKKDEPAEPGKPAPERT